MIIGGGIILGVAAPIFSYERGKREGQRGERQQIASSLDMDRHDLLQDAKFRPLGIVTKIEEQNQLLRRAGAITYVLDNYFCRDTSYFRARGDSLVMSGCNPIPLNKP